MIADLYKPYREKGTIDNEMENLSLKGFGSDINTGPAAGEWLIPAKISEDRENVYITADLPGMTIEDIDITIDGSVLTIRGERKRNDDHVIGAKFYGSFHHSIRLETVVMEDLVIACFEGNLLKITLPKDTRHMKIRVEKA